MPRHITSNVELQQVVTELLDKSISVNTRAVYQQGFQAYKQFLAMYNVSFDHAFPPISQELLIYFVAYCQHTLSLKYTTIKLYLSGIRFTYLEKGIPNPFQSNCQSMERLKLILNAIRKTESKSGQLSRLPITVDILHNICSTLRKNAFDVYTNILLQAMYTVAFFGFFRCGELTIRTTFDPTCHLTCQDVQIQHKTVKIFLKTSKADRFHRGTDIVLYSNDTDICPVKAMCKYMQIRKHSMASKDEPFFVTNIGLPVNRTFFIECLKQILDRGGVDSTKYNGHSFRIGAATSAACARMEDHLIKSLGRWSSDCYTRYIQTPQLVLRDAQHSMVNSQK
jgi:hypothetical protein